MELLLIRPTDTHPQPRQLDGPVSLALALALMIERPPEEAPGLHVDLAAWDREEVYGLLRRKRKEPRAAGQLHGDRALAHRLASAGA